MFEQNLYTMIDLSIKLINTYEALATSSQPELDEDDLMQIDQAKPRLLKELEDDIFLAETVLDRNEFI